MDGSARERPDALVEHYFRHEYGRLVSTLARAYGVHRLEAVEDAVQAALMLALDAWAMAGAPADPGAWLYRVAQNKLIDLFRSARHKTHADASEAAELAAEEPSPPGYYPREIHDDQLRMLFVCCDDAIPAESQLVLALKTLCGFSCEEIARGLFVQEGNVRKRLTRARERLRTLSPSLDTPDDTTLRARIDRVHTVIYLLFNEGYHSASPDQVVRRELCAEAIRLATLTVEHPIGNLPSTCALLALMHFHYARLDARLDPTGSLLLMEDQDRSRFDGPSIRRGCAWLDRAAAGDSFSRYHAEAGIAAEHCLASTFADTRWSEIADLYAMLEQLAPSPLHTLNRAIAVAQDRGPEAGLALLAAVDAPPWLRTYHLWHATLGELHRRAGRLSQARIHITEALLRAPTAADQTMLARRLALCADA